ncbi:MAG: maleylpyruvate isomerase family mycothiol-dependent enzyme [Humibacillus sp.]
MPSSSPGAPLPFARHLSEDSARFRAVLAAAPSTSRVPTCPDWQVDDLLWHLTEVQWFWGEIAERGLTDPGDLDAMNAARPERPAARAALLETYDSASERLQRVLTGLSPETPLWMWADDKSAGYIARRQAHEALIHRLDAELTTGERTSIDPRLACDGVDEALRVMRGHEPEPDLDHVPTSGAVTISAVDTMSSWTVTPVRVTGTWNGDEIDVERLLVADGPVADGSVADGSGDGPVAEIAGTSADLDCWLWNRPTEGPVTREGDETALAAVDRVLLDSID